MRHTGEKNQHNNTRLTYIRNVGENTVVDLGLYLCLINCSRAISAIVSKMENLHE